MIGIPKIDGSIKLVKKQRIRDTWDSAGAEYHSGMRYIYMEHCFQGDVGPKIILVRVADKTIHALDELGFV